MWASAGASSALRGINFAGEKWIVPQSELRFVVELRSWSAMRGIRRFVVAFVALAATSAGGFVSLSTAQPVNDGMYLRMRNAEVRLNALENQHAIARLKNTPAAAAPVAPLGSWIPGGPLAGEDARVQIEALQKQVQAQNKALQNLQTQVARLCEAERSVCAGNR